MVVAELIHSVVVELALLSQASLTTTKMSRVNSTTTIVKDMKYQKNVRLRHYDYSGDGAYFVTICTNRKQSLIGHKERTVIEQELKGLEDRFSGVKIDYYGIMKDHLHIIFLFNQAKTSLPKVIQAFKSLTTLKLKRQGYKGEVFWQRNYYEHIIRSEKALEKIREYVLNNPLVEELKLEEIYGRT